MEKLHAIDREVKAIVTTGYSNDPVPEDFRQHGFACGLTKSYKVDNLRLETPKALKAE